MQISSMNTCSIVLHKCVDNQIFILKSMKSAYFKKRASNTTRGAGGWKSAKTPTAKAFPPFLINKRLHLQ